MAITQEYKNDWTKLEKFTFIFIFTYLSLYIILMFLGTFLETPIRLIGKSIGINYSYEVNGYGSGDQTFSYLKLLLNVFLSISIGSFWYIFDRSRKSYNKLLYWFLVVLRVYLVFFMFTYGFVKIIQLQFPYPSLARMMQPLGEFSPMGLAWTYLGYSKGFNVFMGAMEVLGGLLLIPRRTSTLGAFIVMGVMSHVAMMNFAYDIPVKIFSVHLTLIALFIFSTDIKRFINIFITNKPAKAVNFYHPIKDKTYHKSIFWIKLGLTSIFIGLILIKGVGNGRGKSSINQPHLYGVWETEYYIKNGDTIPPLLTNNERWRYLIVDQNKITTMQTMDGVNHAYFLETDSISKKAKIYGAGTNSKKYSFKYELLSPNTLELNGTLYLNETSYLNELDIKLKRKDLLLNSRGFNWINERPFNR